MVTIEALACGTPVIGTPHGALPELVEHRTTGFLASTVDDLAAAVVAADQIDRRACRHHAETRFAVQHMTHHHERLYRQVIQTWASP